MYRLVLFVLFLLLSSSVFSQDSISNTDTLPFIDSTDPYTHEIGTERFPAPQSTLIATLMKGMFSFNISRTALILVTIGLLLLMLILIIVLVRWMRRKLRE